MNSKRILVVNEERTSEMVKRELEDQGHEVDEASNFNEEAQRDVYDAVVTEAGEGFLTKYNELPESTVVYTTHDPETVEDMLNGEINHETGFTAIKHQGEQDVFYVGKKNSQLEDLDYVIDRI